MPGAGAGGGFSGGGGISGVGPASGPTSGGGGAGGVGPYTTAPRGPTSRCELKIPWEFPTYQDKAEAQDGRTQAVRARHALSLEDTFAYLTGEDHRPLLVLRECLKCNGTDDALMTRQADNERTLLMARWFHCIKLPPDVLAEDHPFHALFAQAKPGHLFFSRWDGSGRKDLTGQQSRTELWDLMGSFLASEYERKADASLKQLLGILDDFDRLDRETLSVKDQVDDLIEKGQGSSPKVEKLKEKLASIEAAKVKARAEAVKLSELKLRDKKTAEAAPDAGSRETSPKTSEKT